MDHLVENHVSVELKYRELELNVKTGRAGYRTKLYENVIPHEGEVFVTGDDRVGIYRNERTKKTKLNTPVKSELLSASDDCVTDSINLSSLLSDMDIGTIIHDFDTEESENSEDMVELMKIMPTVLEHLRENGHLQSYTKWCHLIARNKFKVLAHYRKGLENKHGCFHAISKN